ncbi:transforming acidic coiled-coil-containing protein 2 isoform x1 [Limosa lapponica baueri]|uniref:Transforming acidic coiled-coil-containing protein 2 isoform x1 n=1 Tax=Limosa lapponica baueri TaxID=1758121 RepID=A0A2I0TE80_LIMLA|nr:transforming acidic coiled-coil-containing protein 2 isoform x1 [Limosa lapponica baueri]
MKMCPGFPGEVREASRLSYSLTYRPSISNEGVSSAEDLSHPNSSVVSSEVTGQTTILQDQGGRADSNFLKQAAGARERSLPTSVPLAHCAKEGATAALRGSNDKFPTPGCTEAAAPPVNDKEGIARAESGDGDPQRDDIAAISTKNSENDPRSPRLEPSPPPAITEMQGAAQMSPSELGSLWQGEQLGARREPPVSTLPQGKEAGDYFTAQEAKQERGVLEVGQLQQGRQNADGGEGLLMKEETLILNYPATGGSDGEKFGAIVNAQGFTGMSEVCNLQMGAVTTAKGDEANLSGSKGEQSEACTLMSELPSNSPNLLLVPKAEEPSREYLPGNDSQDPVRSEAVKTASEKNQPIFQRELQKEDELVSAEHFSVPLSFKREEEQKSAVTTESPKDEASSNEIIKADDVSRESTTLSETESVISPTKENSLGKHQTVVKSFVEDTDLALRSECKPAALGQAQQEQVAAESHQNTQMACSETSQAVVGTSGPAPRQVHVEEEGDNHISCPPESDTCGSPEALECSIRELQENAGVPTTLPQAEQTEESASVAGDLISNTGLEQQKQQSLTTVTGAEDQEHKERALKHDRPLDLNNHSNIPEIPLNISNNLNKESSVPCPAPVQCGSDTAEEKDVDKGGAVVSEDTCGGKRGQNTSGVTVLHLRDCEEQNKTDLEAEAKCCSKQISDKPEQDNNSLIWASQHEAACHSDAFPKESDKDEEPGRECGIKDNAGESRAAAISALPGGRDSASATNISQALPGDTEIAHASDNSEKNDPQISQAETAGEMPLMAKKSEKIEGLTANGEIIRKDGNVEISSEDSAPATETSDRKSDKSPGAQRSPSPLRAHGEAIPTDNSYKSSRIQKTPEEPGYCPENFTALSTGTSVLSHPSQQPGNGTDNGAGGELLPNELEAVACPDALESNSNLQIAAGSQVSAHSGPSPRVCTGKPANSENSSAGGTCVNGKDVPNHSFQGDGDRSSAPPQALNVGQSMGNLPRLNSEKLKKEVSAVKSKETESEVNFKEQQSDSSAESLLALPTLEGKLLSLSSAGKQEGCNEEIATDSCVDDKYGKILEKPGNSEKMEELLKENTNVTRAGISISEQSAENSGREHEALTCSSLDIGSSLPDFREHISQIFKKSVHSTLSAELPQLLSENHAGFKQSPVAKDLAELCGAENFSESNQEGKGAPEGTSEAEGQGLSLATETSCKAAKGKSLQEENTVAELPPASLQDAEKRRQLGSFSEVVPRDLSIK